MRGDAPVSTFRSFSAGGEGTRRGRRREVSKATGQSILAGKDPARLFATSPSYTLGAQQGNRYTPTEPDKKNKIRRRRRDRSPTLCREAAHVKGMSKTMRGLEKREDGEGKSRESFLSSRKRSARAEEETV